MRKLLLLIVVLGGLRAGAQVRPVAGAGATADYKTVHAKAIVVDTHNDVLSSATIGMGLDWENDLTGKTHSDLARFKRGGVDVQVFSIFCDDRWGKGSAFHQADRKS